MTIKTKILNDLAIMEIRPSKGLGQHFLIEKVAYKKIIDASQIEKGETVVEVGPGLGTLTESLAESGAKVIALEKDRKLITFLESEFKNRDVKILEGDALKINPLELNLKDWDYKIVANIPYYITSKLLRNILEFWPRPKLIVLLLQREVAQRIMAKPPHMNILAISIQYFADAKIIGTVPRGSFYPMPKVDSAIIKITPRNQPQDQETEKQFFKTIRTGFSSKRKKLINNLATGFNLDKKDLENILKKTGVDASARPENLTIPQWQELANLLIKK